MGSLSIPSLLLGLVLGAGLAAGRLTEPKPSNAGVVVNSAFADTLLQAPPQPRKQG